MNYLKRLLAFLLILTVLLALHTGCEKEEQTPAGTVSNFESQTHVSIGTSDVGTSDDASKEPLTGEFVVSEKKYDYKDANMELLCVENQTNRHFNVTIHGKYLDANGAVLKEETQTYTCFPAGWSNYFQFYPRIAFDSFTYEIETEEYANEALYTDADGVPLVSYLDVTYVKNLYWTRNINGSDENGHIVEARAMVFDTIVENHHPTISISIEYHVIVLDEKGEVYLLGSEYNDMMFGIGNDIHGTCIDPVGTEENGKARVPTQLWSQAPGQDETIPENVQGVFTAIFALTDVVDYQEFINQLNPNGIG